MTMVALIVMTMIIIIMIKMTALLLATSIHLGSVNDPLILSVCAYYRQIRIIPQPKCTKGSLFDSPIHSQPHNTDVKDIMLAHSCMETRE
jgi:hypothetical protein